MKHFDWRGPRLDNLFSEDGLISDHELWHAFSIRPTYNHTFQLDLEITCIPEEFAEFLKGYWNTSLTNAQAWQPRHPGLSPHKADLD